MPREGATCRSPTRTGAPSPGCGARESWPAPARRFRRSKRRLERSRATSRRPSASSLPLDEQAEQADARRGEDHVEDEHELEIVAELSKRDAREQIAGRDDGGDERGR